ncbi:MAG: hypothetical protein NUW37_14360 [Planctomycetes bacterium]|nr:hypothetical protein [Planctomycetota bacterium]
MKIRIAVRDYFFAVFIAIVLCCVFGMLHNQMSYSVSAEYFTKFKFIQFRLADSESSERWRAAIVGLLASWWMGIPIGLVMSSAARSRREPSRTFVIAAKMMIATLVVTVCFSLTGLLIGFFVAGPERPAWFHFDEVEDARSFLRAGWMHNFSYLGGVVMMIVWVVYAIVWGRRSKRATSGTHLV